jgi:hypothetical protein
MVMGHLKKSCVCFYGSQMYFLYNIYVFAWFLYTLCVGIIPSSIRKCGQLNKIQLLEENSFSNQWFEL